MDRFTPSPSFFGYFGGRLPLRNSFRRIKKGISPINQKGDKSNNCANIGLIPFLPIHSDAHYKKWPHPISDAEVKRGLFLRSLNPKEELACMLAARGHCLDDNNRLTEACVAYAQASEQAPANPGYPGFLARTVRMRQGPIASRGPTQRRNDGYSSRVSIPHEVLKPFGPHFTGKSPTANETNWSQNPNVIEPPQYNQPGFQNPGFQQPTGFTPPGYQNPSFQQPTIPGARRSFP